MLVVAGRCEAGACLEVVLGDKFDLIRSTVTGEVMRCTRAELLAFRDRIVAGELSEVPS